MAKLTTKDYIKDLTGQDMPEVKEQPKEKLKKLAIIGTALSRFKAPYNDPDFDIWGVAHCLLLQDIPRLDRVFEIHLPYIYEKEVSPFSQKPIIYHANKEHAAPWRKPDDIEVITPKYDPALNKQIVFPREELKAKYKDIMPVSDAFYATNSIAWMIVWAIDLGYDEIHLYGIHLETDSEWQYERPCNEWWLGVFAGLQLAKGKKGVVYIPEESDVLKAYHEYGFADIEVRRKKLNARFEHFNKQIGEMSDHRTNLVKEVQRLQTELATPIPEKIKWLKGQIEMYSKEIEKFEKTDEAKYKEELDGIIKNKIIANDQQIRQLDARINCFNGAKEQVQYSLKELNA